MRPDDDFAMSWEVDAKSSKRLSDIATALKGADRLILATDPDREGEAISWHVLEDLKRRKAVKGAAVERVVFNAITKSSILEAMKHPRDIDMELVDAYLARRALDYLVGFTLSPVLWRKLPGSRSAGRVQSVALRLIVDREIEIEKFRTQEYWTVEADVSAGGDPFLARLVKHDGKALKKFDLPDEASAHAARAVVRAAAFTVSAIEKKPARRSPPPPFTTSTLQQEASRKLGFSAQRTMQAAQRLYEGVDLGGETVGLITYMRTDGVQSAPEALTEAREVIGGLYGKDYVPESPRHYKVKAKNAQEAHEAIRPTSLERNPGKLRLEPDLGRLYELIWKRMIASQMESARIERTTIDLESADGRTGLRANGQVVLFPGYLAVYEEGRDDASGEEDEGRLPKVDEGAAAKVAEARADQHFTEPPPRYSEASLVKRMEELGIGRPSTYASILTVLRDRAYVKMDKNRFVPEDAGRLVTAFLEQFFARYVEYDFTAGLERTPRPRLGGRPRLEGSAAGVLDRVQRRRRRHRRAAHHPGARRPQRRARPAHLPRQGRRDGPPRLPRLRHGPAVAEDRTIRRLHRLLQLSGMPLHPSDRRRRGRRRRGLRRSRTRRRSGQRPRDMAQDRPLRPLCRRDRRPGEARQPAQGLAARDDGRRQGPAPAAPAARSRRASRDGRHDPGRHRPLWSLRPARQDLRQPAHGGRGVRGRPQPRRRGSGRETRRRRSRRAGRGRYIGGAEGTRTPPHHRQAGARAGGPLWPLHQARGGERQRAEGIRSRRTDDGGSRRPPRRARGRRRQEQGRKVAPKKAAPRANRRAKAPAAKPKAKRPAAQKKA